MLPPDSHVHTEWSWDAPRGSMERTCTRAVELGVPAVAFTEHLDFTASADSFFGAQGMPALRARVDAEGMFHPPLLDVDGYLESIERCRRLFPELRIVTGVEIGEPHWHREEIAEIVERGVFDRVLISMHSAQDRGGRIVPVRDAYEEHSPAEVVRQYLEDTIAMIEGSDVGAVLAHIDYPVRAWPDSAGPYRPELFEGEIRTTLGALAASGRALEVNTRMPLDGQVVGWWRDAGGKLLTFGSDAHEPGAVARRFAAAAEVAEAHGFRPGKDVHDMWWV